MNINSFSGLRNTVRLHTKRSFQQANYRIKSDYFGKSEKKDTKKSSSKKDEFKEISDKLKKINASSVKNNKKNSNSVFEKQLEELNKLNINKSRKSKDSKTAVKKSVLNLTNRGELTARTKSGKIIELKCSDGTVSMKENEDKLSPDDIQEVENIGKFLTTLNYDKSCMMDNKIYSKEEVKNMFGAIGVHPGFFELKRRSGNEEFMMLDNGTVYTSNQVEAERNYYNNMNLIQNAGFTKNATCVIDGIEYRIGEDGHFNIPKGVRCVAENMILNR